VTYTVIVTTTATTIKALRHVPCTLQSVARMIENGGGNSGSSVRMMATTAILRLPLHRNISRLLIEAAMLLLLNPRPFLGQHLSR
jgi:hypothetical protein